MEAQLLSMLQGVSDKVDAVNEGVNIAKGQIRDVKAILLGGGDEETPHGRIPMLEASRDDHEKRLQILEEAHVRYGVYGRFFSLGGGLLAGTVGFLAGWLGRFLFGK